ncbi:class I SAM-dependent methyltransferase, partial [Actinomadura sp. GC306]|uniref:class I SAM-dependent methyltransferase n=1 Tax=Actinomadura sp. GC306 TaxID=2530367 RepID=UPI001049982C
STFDACVTYNGLHCLQDPAAALRELTRVLRPGGTLRGTTLIRGTSPRHDTQIALFQRLGIFGSPGTAADLRTWLLDAALTNVTLTHSGAVTTFTARRMRDAPLPGIR